MPASRNPGGRGRRSGDPNHVAPASAVREERPDRRSEVAEHRTIPVVDRQLDVRSVQLIENPGVVNGHRHVQGATISEPNERR